MDGTRRYPSCPRLFEAFSTHICNALQKVLSVEDMYTRGIPNKTYRPA